MAAAIGLREDYDAGALRAIAKRAKDGPQARRLLALASMYDGGARSEAAKIGGVGLQVIRDWVLRFNAYGPDGLVDCKAPGQAPKLNDAHRAALIKMIEDGPTPAIHGVVRWRIVDLCQWVCHFTLAERRFIHIGDRQETPAGPQGVNRAGNGGHHRTWPDEARR